MKEEKEDEQRSARLKNYTHPNRTKRSVQVIPPEKEDGSTEYKRQVYNPTAARLRSLATQMSYRLDEGLGQCTYEIGVEDNGQHSLLDYSSVSESARMLECIARSLNAVVLERVMIQQEVSEEKDNGARLRSDEPLHVHEAPLFIDTSFSRLQQPQQQEDDGDKEEKSPAGLLSTGAVTRCRLTIQRVETHLLDPSPLSLTALAKEQRSMSSVADGVAAAAEASQLEEEAAHSESKSPPPPVAKGKEKVEDVPTKLAAPASPAVAPDLATNNGLPSVSETLSSRNIRIAVVGNVDAGKSTMIGTLTTSCLDDGRGKSRTAIMKHRHEIESGRTSTATTHLLGFRSTGEPIAGRDSIRANKRKTEDEVARESYRIITLIDLAGHEKYLKTTIHGVSSGMADYSLILVNARHPPTHMTQHHLNLCCSFGIPVVVVFTKIDGCPPHALKQSKEEVFKLLRAPDVGKKPFAVRNEQDVATCMGKLQTLAPVLETSCVSGEGMDLLKKMLFSLPKRRRHESKVSRPFEFLVEDIFNVPGVGAVVSGFVNAGELSVGANSQVYVGPTDDGTFLRTVAKSAHIARINTTHITSGQSACLALALQKDLRKKLRRGMVVLQESPTSTRQFDAEICVLKGEGTTIRRSYQAYVHILNVRQSAFARQIELVQHPSALVPSNHGGEDQEGLVLRPGSRAKVRFEFAKRPEYVRPGMRMLFRDGRVRGVGIITGIPTVPPV